MDDVLVLLSRSGGLTSRGLAVREPVAGDAPQLFGARVLLCRLTADERTLVARMAGVAGVYSGSVPADADLPDDPAGRLAVEAWNVRWRAAAAGGKQRIGEGAAWDDPRFAREGRPSADEE